jgi:PAS domain S-box-containing protein
MIGPFSYSLSIWPPLILTIAMAGLCLYGWRHRRLPGGFVFTLQMLFISLWSLGVTLEMAAVEISDKIFWSKFQFFWLGPAAIASLFFILEYAGLDRFLKPRFIIPVLLFVLLGSFLIITDGLHHWVWQDFWLENGRVVALRGIGYWTLISVGYLLTFLTIPIIIWLFIRSPRLRWPLGLVLCGHLAVRIGLLIDAAEVHPLTLGDLSTQMMGFNAAMYAIALFVFGMLDPIPVARKTVIEQMREGMLVLDQNGVIIDLNAAAAGILNLPVEQACGREASRLLPGFEATCLPPEAEGSIQSEVSLGKGGQIHYYRLDLSSLRDRRDQVIGSLVLLHDVTQEKRSQAHIMENQRVLAVLGERERLARELHDQLAQELSFINLEAQAASALIEAGETTQAVATASRLAEIARQTQIDVRELISFLINPKYTTEGFLAVLRQTVTGFSQRSGIQVDLQTPEQYQQAQINPAIEVQLLRITQEALTNIRKHSCAQHTKVSLANGGGQVKLTIEDDGIGIRPEELSGDGRGYGLQIMRERAAEVGGKLEISTALGKGTCISVCVPAGSQSVSEPADPGPELYPVQPIQN